MNDNSYTISKGMGSLNRIMQIKYELKNDSEYNNELIEIIIPTYKRCSLLLAALESAINQNTKCDYLITVLDDDPQSKLFEILATKLNAKNIRYIINNENLGLFGNWNRALQVSKAPYIALLHDDDELSSNYIEVIASLINRLGIVGVITHTPVELYKRKEKKKSITQVLRNNSFEEISWQSYLYGNRTNASAMVINKTLGLNIGGWNENKYPSADWMFNSRMAYESTVYKIHLQISKYRWDVNVSLEPNMKSSFYKMDLTYIVDNKNDSDLKLKVYQKLFIEFSILHLSLKNYFIEKDQCQKHANINRNKIISLLIKVYILRKTFNLAWLILYTCYDLTLWIINKRKLEL